MLGFIQIAFFTTISVFLTVCNKNKSETEIVAEMICECMEPSLLIQDELDAANDDPLEIAAILDEFNEEIEQIVACHRKIEEKYQEKLLDKAFEDEVIRELNKICPKIAAKIEPF